MDFLKSAVENPPRTSPRAPLASPRDLETGDGGSARVAFRVEALACRSARALFCALYGSVGLCVLILLGIVLVNQHRRYEEDPSAVLTVAGVNLSVASFCVSVTTFCLLSTSISTEISELHFRIFTLRHGGITWSRQRKRWMVFRMLEMGVQSINSILYFTPNLLVIVTQGRVPARIIYVLEVLRLSSWSLVFFFFMLQARLLNVWVDKNSSPVLDEDSILLDAPWWTHWFLGLSWCITQVILLIYGWTQLQDAEGPFVNNNMELQHPYGQFRNFVVVCILLVFYQIGTFHSVNTGYKEFAKKSYVMFRWVNVRLRYHQIQVFLVGGMVILSFLAMSVVQPHSHFMTVLKVLGVLPAHLVLASLALLNYYLLCPMKMEEGASINMWPGRLSWLEHPQKSLQDKNQFDWHPEESFKPCFSFERMVKTWYWSLLAYRCGNADAKIRFDVAKSMYGVEQHMIVRIKLHDITGIVAWGKNTIVIVFRGTSSLTNLRTDLHAWLVPHPPLRGTRWQGTRPLVHTGFLSSWEASGLKESILVKVKSVIASGSFDLQHGKVILSGHSLGGALAVLAALDISKECGLASHQLSCYTFGAPRVGNQAFKEEYNARIPDTWQIANGRDVVPSIPNFLGLFRRVGERVIINNAGDMVVRPLFLEKSFSRPAHFLTVPTTFTDHLMRTYGKSLTAIVHAQYIKWKGLPGGIDAMNSMLANGESCTLVRALGIKQSTLKRLRSLSSKVWERNNQASNSIKVFGGRVSPSRGSIKAFPLGCIDLNNSSK